MKNVILILVLVGSAWGTTYTVGSGKTYATIQACANVAVAGDTCTIYAGSYAGWTQPASGSSGLPITFTANTGDTITVTGNADLSSRSYITISYLTFGNVEITGNGSSSHNVITHNTFGNTGFYINSEQGSGGSDNVISYNVVDLTGHTDNVTGFKVYGDRNLLEHNEIRNGQGDCFDLGGVNVVVRYNYCHDMTGAISGEHIDFVQVVGGATPTLSFSLIEHNTEKHCYNDLGNCHFMMVRASGGQVADTLIVRYNYTYNYPGDSEGNLAAIGSHTDGTNTTPNGVVYNNTAATNALTTGNGACVGFDSGYGTALNNICYNTNAGPWSPTIFTNGGLGNGNLAFTSGYSGSWNSPYSTEATYAALHNQDPKFANYPADGTLQSSSPAIGAGVAITNAVGSGTNITSLKVASSHGLQPGWAGTSADWIRIGSNTAVQISSINYTTDVVSLSTAESWANNDPIYLYKLSDGTVVLPNAAPDLGAFPTNGKAPAVTSTVRSDVVATATKTAAMGQVTVCRQ